MALCVALQADGTLHATGEAVEVCTGYVLQSGSEYSLFQALHDIFVWPAPETLTTWFMSAFILVLTFNALGYIVGAVVKMVSTDRD